MYSSRSLFYLNKIYKIYTYFKCLFQYKLHAPNVPLILLFVSRLTPLSVDRTMLFEQERRKNVHPIHPNWGRTDSQSLCLWRYYGTTSHFSCLWSTPLQSSCYFFNTCEFLSQSISLTHCITHMKYFCFEKLAGYLSPMILRQWAFTFLCVRAIFIVSAPYKTLHISTGFECVKFIGFIQVVSWNIEYASKMWANGMIFLRHTTSHSL